MQVIVSDNAWKEIIGFIMLDTIHKCLEELLSNC